MHSVNHEAAGLLLAMEGASIFTLYFFGASGSFSELTFKLPRSITIRFVSPGLKQPVSGMRTYDDSTSTLTWSNSFTSNTPHGGENETAEGLGRRERDGTSRRCSEADWLPLCICDDQQYPSVQPMTVPSASYTWTQPPLIALKELNTIKQENYISTSRAAIL